VLVDRLLVVAIDHHDLEERVQVLEAVVRLQLQQRRFARGNYRGDVARDVDVLGEGDAFEADAAADFFEAASAKEKPVCSSMIALRSSIRVLTS
jgi:hypothetical protein